MTKNPVCWFEIYVNDIARAKAFYESVLAVTLERIESPSKFDLEMWGFPSDMDSYGASGALVKMADFNAGNNSTVVYFSCEDCSVEEARVTESGGVVQMPKTSIGEYGFISLSVDTEGNIFGLHSLK